MEEWPIRLFSYSVPMPVSRCQRCYCLSSWSADLRPPGPSHSRRTFKLVCKLHRKQNWLLSLARIESRNDRRESHEYQPITDLSIPAKSSMIAFSFIPCQIGTFCSFFSCGVDTASILDQWLTAKLLGEPPSRPSCLPAYFMLDRYAGRKSGSEQIHCPKGK